MPLIVIYEVDAEDFFFFSFPFFLLFYLKRLVLTGKSDFVEVVVEDNVVAVVVVGLAKFEDDEFETELSLMVDFNGSFIKFGIKSAGFTVVAVLAVTGEVVDKRFKFAAVKSLA